MAVRDSISIDEGATFERTWVYKNADGSPFDFSGYIIRAQLRQQENGNLVANFGAEFSDPTAGLFKIVLTASASVGFEIVDHVYDVKADNASGSIMRLVEGDAKIRPEVTQ